MIIGLPRVAFEMPDTIEKKLDELPPWERKGKTFMDILGEDEKPELPLQRDQKRRIEFFQRHASEWARDLVENWPLDELQEQAAIASRFSFRFKHY